MQSSMVNLLKISAIAAAIAFQSSVSRAVPVTVAGWDFSTLSGGTNNFGPSPYNATTSASGLTVGGLTRGAGVTQSGSAAANGWGGTGFDATTEANAITASDFITFTITRNTAPKLSLTQINAYNVRRSSQGPTTGQWQYSVNGGAFSDIGSDIDWGNSSTSGNTQSAINLSGISALQNVAAGAPITFRLVSWGGSSGGTWYLHDPTDTTAIDFSIQGIVSVPEPAAVVFGLLICGVTGLAVGGRKLKNWLWVRSAK